ncbi:MAG: guanine deaminase [Paracoccaceae bacterium]
MTERLLRGRVFGFHRAPEGIDDREAYVYEEDGAVLVGDGIVEAAGTFEELKGRALEIIDHRPNLILPGFIDPHIHFPQMQVIGSYGAQLLEWLNRYTFPAETRFGDAGHAERIARLFFDELLRNGTTTAVAFCSVHKASAEAYFREAVRRNLCMIGGKVLMDRNAPDGLRDTPQSGYDDTRALIADWHGQGRVRYAITPRFAITSTPEQMETAQALAAEYPDLHIQTHLSENGAEIAYAAKLYPDAKDYLDIYDHYGLLGRNSLMGHSIHLSQRERARMAETGTVAVHCPTSNLFIGSGLFDLAALEDAGVRTAIATDVGGGTSYSMLKTLDEAYKIQQLQNRSVDPLSAFYWATLGNAEALSLADRIGSLAAGSDADIIVLDSHATPAMSVRMETVETLPEELFVLQTLGDDRAVVAAYVAGELAGPADN